MRLCGADDLSSALLLLAGSKPHGTLSSLWDPPCLSKPWKRLIGLTGKMQMLLVFD